MKINNEAYKLGDGDVLIESNFMDSMHKTLERYTYQRSKFIEKALLKSMSKEQLNEIKHLVEAELTTRKFRNGNCVF